MPWVKKVFLWSKDAVAAHHELGDIGARARVGGCIAREAAAGIGALVEDIDESGHR
jgi:hypothetical protein